MAGNLGFTRGAPRGGHGGASQYFASPKPRKRQARAAADRRRRANRKGRKGARTGG